ncbi:enoyl-CoA hydratase-related protein [Halanaerobaculum tunisiense]
MNFESLEIEYKDLWAVVKIARPKAMNSLNSTVLNELRECIENLDGNDEIKTIVITGKGKAFVAGADISQMKSMDSLEAKEFGRLGQETFRTIEEASTPVIAAINGFALGGGCELALSCDIRVASTKAKLGQPEVGLGIIPGFGGTQRLPKVVGEGKAKELILTADNIDAQEALDVGLVNDVVAADELMDAVEEIVSKIASKSSVILGLAKEAINTGLEKEINEGAKIEANLFSICFSTEDQNEGMDAFLNKRKPNFSDK